MPDAFDPKPFPAGMLRDIDDEPRLVRGGGFRIDGRDDDVIRLADAEARITGHITCSARMAIGEAGYARVR